MKRGVDGSRFSHGVETGFVKEGEQGSAFLWVETLVLAFSATVSPLLEDTFKDVENVEEMKKDKLSDQATIIDSQNKLIEAKDEQVKKLQEIVQSEVKSVQSETKTFSSVIQKEIKEQSKKNVVSNKERQ